MISKELNAKILDLDLHRLDLVPEPLKDFNKVVPYYGFNWRNVNFDKLNWLGISPYTTLNEQEFVPWVGFLAIEKRNHKRWQSTQEQTDRIKELLEGLVAEPSVEKTLEIYNYLQGCKEIIKEE
jgi:hypothetical protein